MYSNVFFGFRIEAKDALRGLMKPYEAVKREFPIEEKPEPDNKKIKLLPIKDKGVIINRTMDVEGNVIILSLETNKISMH